MIRILSGIFALILVASPVLADTAAKNLFGAVDLPSSHQATAVGAYSKGCLAGAVELPENGPTWQAMRLSRNRNWGHPNLIAYIERLSERASQLGWNGLYIGDMAQPRGGPMNGGHASHQSGLDVDIWLSPAMDLNLSRDQRESLSAINVRTADQRGLNDHWTRNHYEILRAAAMDPAVARIFITPPAKLWMCKNSPAGDRAWLHKIRPWWAHNDHFHVRLNCPRGATLCEEQDPIPAGDGCKDAIWWVTEALEPQKPDPNAPIVPPKRPLTMADLPEQCRAVLQE